MKLYYNNNYYYYYFVLPLLLLHDSSASGGGGGGLRQTQRATVRGRVRCDETENPLQRQGVGCPCFSLDTIMGRTTDLNETEYCDFYEYFDSDDQCHGHMGFSAHWNEEVIGSGPTPYSHSDTSFSVDRNCDDYGDSGGYVFVRNDWFEDEEGVIRIDLGQGGGVLTFVPPEILRGGEFDWNEVWPVFADVAGNPKDPSKWNSTVSFQAEERTYTFDPYPTLGPDPYGYGDYLGLNTFDVNDYAAGSLECGEDFDTDNDRFYIILDGELLDSCPKSIVDDYSFDSSIISNINKEYTTRQRMQCYANVGQSKGINEMVDGSYMQSTGESHHYNINYGITEDEYEDCFNILTSLKDKLQENCQISN